MSEFERLMSACKEHREAGEWVVAVGPTKVLSMVNLTAATEAMVTKDSMDWAALLASADRTYRELRTDDEKRQWIEHKARGAVQWNRSIESGTPLVAAISAFHGLDTLVHSDEEAARGKSYPTTSKFGRVVRHDLTVRGFLSMGEGFQSGSTTDLAVKASLLAKVVAPLQRKAPTLHMATSCKRIVALDCRHETTVTETCYVRVHEVLFPKWRRVARTAALLTRWYADYKERAYAPSGVGMKRARESFEAACA